MNRISCALPRTAEFSHRGPGERAKSFVSQSELSLERIACRISMQVGAARLALSIARKLPEVRHSSKRDSRFPHMSALVRRSNAAPANCRFAKLNMLKNSALTAIVPFSLGSGKFF